MKKLITISIFCLFLSAFARAQEYVFDPQYFASVTANGAVRSGAEVTHQQYLGQINTNVNNINTNVGSVVLAQTMIYKELANVNSALTDGLEVKNMTIVIADMIEYLNEALQMARAQPYLLIFTSKIDEEMRQKGMLLLTDVSSYILESGNNVLSDYNARDELLRKVTQQLQILDALAYGAWKAMYWAKERGVIASLDPFADYINRDKTYVDQIITNAKYLHQ